MALTAARARALALAMVLAMPAALSAQDVERSEAMMNGFSLREPARLDLVQAGIGIIWRRE